MKTHFNYRVLKQEITDVDCPYTNYFIGEVYYTDNKPIGFAPQKNIEAQSLEDLKETLKFMLQALDAPVLDINTDI